MNPPLAPPRRGTDRTRTDACSPPGRGWGWVGSWKSHPSLPKQRGCLLPLLDGRSDNVAVLGPTAVVILHVVQAKQVFQHKPGVAGALADAAIGDGRFLGIDAFLLKIDRVQILSRFERSVRLHGSAPRDAFGAGDMAAALGGFGHAWRRDDFAGELIRAA